MNNQFRIVVTAYNAEKYIEKCISSITWQRYTNYKVIVIDDASTDNTFKKAQSCVKASDNRFIFIKNKENIKAIANYVKYIPQICNNDEDIIVSLDGDDYLADRSVLEYLNNIYQNSDIQFTYGSYITLSDLKSGKKNADSNKPIKNIRDVARIGFNMSHLKTWKYKAWKMIKDEDLRRADRRYIQRAWDQPIVCHLAYYLGDIKYIKYIDKILYVYNNQNPINEYRLNDQ